MGNNRKTPAEMLHAGITPMTLGEFLQGGAKICNIPKPFSDLLWSLLEHSSQALLSAREVRTAAMDMRDWAREGTAVKLNLAEVLESLQHALESVRLYELSNSPASSEICDALAVDESVDTGAGD